MLLLNQVRNIENERLWVTDTVVVHALERLQKQGDDKVPCIHHAVSVYHSFGSSVTYFT
jgi:hypothetical protein